MKHSETLQNLPRNDSALAVLNIIQGVQKAGSEGFDAYARVLLNWHLNGQDWIKVTDENQAPVKAMLLHALKDATDPQLRREIEEALKIKPTQKSKRQNKG